MAKAGSISIGMSVNRVQRAKSGAFATPPKNPPKQREYSHDYSGDYA